MQKRIDFVLKERTSDMNFLSLEVPVIQGGMGVGVSLGGLAGAVAKEGAVGTISTAQIGFREPDFEQNPAECNL